MLRHRTALERRAPAGSRTEQMLFYFAAACRASIKTYDWRAANTTEVQSDGYRNDY